MSHIPPIAKGPTRTVPPPRPVGSTPSRAASVAGPPVSLTDPAQRTPLMILGGLTALLVLAYWDMLALTSAAWRDDLYQHGWIVPAFAIVLLWMRWEPLGPVPMLERWMGLGLIAVGLLVRLFAAEYGIEWLDRLSFMPSIFGVFMLVGGMSVMRWAWPALGFLIFMFPLPHRLELSVLGRLQRFASMCSTFVLQTMGVSAFRQGNLISVPGADLNIADACSGLKMATIFGAMAVGMIFIIERPWWDKFVILLSAIPIALAVNIVRITVTGLLFMMVPENEFIHKLCHDWAGILIMMPLAMAFLWLELQILERLTVPVDTMQLRPVAAPRGVSPVPLR